MCTLKQQSNGLLYTGRKRERERESILTAHQHKTDHSVPFEVKMKANGIIHPSIYLKSGNKAHRTGTIQRKT